MQDDHETEAGIAEFIRAAVRPTGETARLTRELSRHCWPGGTGDRTDPVARGWLRMWGPNRVVVEVGPCECHTGHCMICN
jgi:hypothetical protein